MKLWQCLTFEFQVVEGQNEYQGRERYKKNNKDKDIYLNITWNDDSNSLLNFRWWKAKMYIKVEKDIKNNKDKVTYLNITWNSESASLLNFQLRKTKEHLHQDKGNENNKYDDPNLNIRAASNEKKKKKKKTKETHWI